MTLTDFGASVQVEIDIGRKNHDGAPLLPFVGEVLNESVFCREKNKEWQRIDERLCLQLGYTEREENKQRDGQETRTMTGKCPIHRHKLWFSAHTRNSKVKQ